MTRNLRLELTTLADIEPSLEDEIDGIQYQLENEFLPDALKELNIEVANIIAKYRRVIYSRKRSFEELSGRKVRFYVPKRVVKLSEDVYEQYQPLMEI